MRGTSSSTEQVPVAPATTPPQVRREVTRLPVATPTSTRVYGGGSGSDGVFANLAAKPEAGEKTEEHPPVSAVCLTRLRGLG